MRQADPETGHLAEIAAVAVEFFSDLLIAESVHYIMTRRLPSPLGWKYSVDPSEHIGVTVRYEHIGTRVAVLDVAKVR